MLLVVDDDPGFLQDALELLEDDDEILLATSAEQAKSLIREGVGPISLALVDLDLRGQDGFSLIRELRQFVPAIPAIAISGVKRPGVLESSRISGAVDALRKPITPEWRSTIVRVQKEQAAKNQVLKPCGEKDLGTKADETTSCPRSDLGMRLKQDVDRAQAEYLRARVAFKFVVDEAPLCLPCTDEATRLRKVNEELRRTLTASLTAYSEAVQRLSDYVLYRARTHKSDRE